MAEKNVQSNFDVILKYSETTKLQFTLESQRELYQEIYNRVVKFKKEPQINILVIAGLRGTGKTTILTSLLNKFSKSVYTSGDFLKSNDISFNEVIDFADKFDKELVLIDEIHNLENWGELLKINSDLYKKKLFIITGSSALLLREQGNKIKRRAIFYNITPLSFREYLRIKYNVVIDFKVSETIKKVFNVRFDREKYYYELLKLEANVPKEVYSKFSEYMERQFPLTINLSVPYMVTKDIVERAIEKDIPLISSIASSNIAKISRIVQYLASNEKTSINKISGVIGLNQDTVEKIFSALEKADIIRSVEPSNPTNALKGAKRYLFTSPSVRLAYGFYDLQNIIGFAREDLFGMIVFGKSYDLRYFFDKKEYDFVVNNTVFEIGGKQKKARNIIVIAQNHKLKYDLVNRTLYVPLELFSLIL